MAGSPIKPCAPAAGKLSGLGPCTASTPCTIDVIRTDGPWEVTIATEPQGPYERRAIVPFDEAWLRVKSRTVSLPVQGGDSIGAVHLAISVGTSVPRYVGINLQLPDAGLGTCANAPMQSGYFQMSCGL
jgi:hypothetical protein